MVALSASFSGIIISTDSDTARVRGVGIGIIIRISIGIGIISGISIGIGITSGIGIAIGSIGGISRGAVDHYFSYGGGGDVGGENVVFGR